MANEVDPILRRFRTALDEAYGGRIERVVLFGSRARGDARPESDPNVAVFLKDLATGEGWLFKCASPTAAGRRPDGREGL